MTLVYPRRPIVLDGARHLSTNNSVAEENKHFQSSDPIYRTQYVIVTIWYRRTVSFSGSSTRGLIVRASGTSAAGFGLWQQVVTQNIFMHTHNGTSSTSLSSVDPAAWPLNTWTFALLKILPSVLYLRINNGTAATTSHSDGASTSTTAPLMIGRGVPGGAIGASARGLIGDVDSISYIDPTLLPEGDISSEDEDWLWNDGGGQRAIEIFHRFGSAVVNAFECNGSGNLVGVVSGRDLSETNSPGVVLGHVPGPPQYRKKSA